TVVNDTERQAQTRKLLDGVDMALTLGTDRVRVFAGNRTEGLSDEQSMEYIVEGLQQGARYAEEKGVTLCLENHGLLAGKGEQVKGIIEAVGSLALKANPDTGNFMLVNEDSVEAVKVVAPLAGSV